MRKPFNLSHI